MGTVIEVKAWGDFDILQTMCIMVSDEKLNVDSLLKEFYVMNGIESNKGIPCDLLYFITTDFVTFLEYRGFSELKTTSVCFSD